MRDIELELHDVLLDLAPDTHDHEEQARIVAEAAAIYRRASNLKKNIRNADNDKAHEARLADALLQAMGCLEDWNEDEHNMTYVDARGMAPDKIVSHAAKTLVRQSKTKKNFFDLDDSDLDPFLDPVIHNAADYEIEDGYDEEHPSDGYQTPGRPKHRSDSQAR